MSLSWVIFMRNLELDQSGITNQRADQRPLQQPYPQEERSSNTGSGIKLTREQKEEIVRKAYSEGYFRVLTDEQQVLLGVRFLHFESQMVSQEALTQELGVTTRAGVSYAEKRAIQELENLRKLIEGEEVREEWRGKLKDNPRALSYFYSKSKGRKMRKLAKLLHIKNRDVSGILKAQDIPVVKGRPATDLREVFGDDPKRTLELNLEKRSGSAIGRGFGIAATTANRIIKRLEIDRPRKK